mgnify:FL=1
MKKIIYSIALGALTLTNTSCYDVLDKEPLDQYTDAVVWNDPTLIDAFLVTQYMYTPVMVNDATTMFTSWSGSPMNRDDRRGDTNYFFGNSEQVFGVGLTLDVSDEAKYNTGSWTDISWYKLHGITEDGGMLEWWDNAYYTIRNLNELIARVPNSPIDTETAKVRIAEARFLRAYCYFAMVKRYGGVPLLTEAPQLDSSEELLYPKRNSEKELYDFILNETMSISEELTNVKEVGRANKWAALSLHCRAALYAGSIAQYGRVQLDGLLGIPANEASTYYEKAYNAALTIIKESPYKLYNEDEDKVQNFKNIFLKKRNCEAIMVKQHDGPGFQNGGFSTWSWDQCECPRPQVWGLGNHHGPYLEMVEEFEYVDGTSGKFDRKALQNKLWNMDELWKGRDPRFYASIWTNGTPWRDAVAGAFKGDTIDMHLGLIKPDGEIIKSQADQYNGINSIGDQLWAHASEGIVNSGFGIMKYLDPSTNNMSWLCESRTDYQIFRFAEILLNYAEAAFELGRTADALDAINQIRRRAGIKELANIDRDKIRHERKIELAFENHRYWDLRRWREAETALTRSFSGLQYIYDYNSGKFKVVVIDKVDGSTASPTFFNKNYYFPITKARSSQPQFGRKSRLLSNSQRI